MKDTHKQTLLVAGLTCAMAFASTLAQAADKPRSIEYEIKVQRAAEAAIWAMPAVGIRDVLTGSQRDLGYEEGGTPPPARPRFSSGIIANGGLFTVTITTLALLSVAGVAYCASLPLVTSIPIASREIIDEYVETNVVTGIDLAVTIPTAQVVWTNIPYSPSMGKLETVIMQVLFKSVPY